MDIIHEAYNRRGQNYCFWLGIDNASTEGTYTYSSDGTLIDPGVKSVIARANGCDQTGLSKECRDAEFCPSMGLGSAGTRAGTRDCDHVYSCSKSKTYTVWSTNHNGIVCEV